MGTKETAKATGVWDYFLDQPLCLTKEQLQEKLEFEKIALKAIKEIDDIIFEDIEAKYNKLKQAMEAIFDYTKSQPIGSQLYNIHMTAHEALKEV